MHAWTRRSLPIAAAAALALILPTAALAAPPPPASTSSATHSTTGVDALVLSGMHLMNQMTIQAADLAKQKGSTYQVRMLGDRLARDHAMSDSHVITYANAHGVALLSEAQIAQRIQDLVTIPLGAQPGVPQPGGTGAMQQMHQTVQRLQALNGAAFDRAFTQFAQQSQLSAVRMLTAADQKLPKGSGLRSMINDDIPILEQHYSIASQLQMRNAAEAAQGGA
ncbi:MAG TPA: DUF4142 domain-containing protein [Vicinamibacterales bacterium]|jgi:predicted outer membrane protein